MKLQSKVAVVTGGGSGFGEGIAKLLAEHDATVVVADINAEGAARVAAEIEADQRQAYPVTADVSRSDSMAALVQTVLDRSGRLDIFVNNAGISHKNSPLTEVDEVTFDRVYAVNVKSIYLSAVHVVPVFRQQGGGVFLNIASTAGVRPRPGLTWYNGTKGAVITLTKSMAVELATR